MGTGRTCQVAFYSLAPDIVAWSTESYHNKILVWVSWTFLLCPLSDDDVCFRKKVPFYYQHYSIYTAINTNHQPFFRFIVRWRRRHCLAAITFELMKTFIFEEIFTERQPNPCMSRNSREYARMTKSPAFYFLTDAVVLTKY